MHLASRHSWVAASNPTQPHALSAAPNFLFASHTATCGHRILNLQKPSRHPALAITTALPATDPSPVPPPSLRCWAPLREAYKGADLAAVEAQLVERLQRDMGKMTGKSPQVAPALCTAAGMPEALIASSDCWAAARSG